MGWVEQERKRKCWYVTKLTLSDTNFNHKFFQCLGIFYVNALNIICLETYESKLFKWRTSFPCQLCTVPILEEKVPGNSVSTCKNI